MHYLSAKPCAVQGYRDDLYTCVHQVAGAFASVTDGSQAPADSLRLYLLQLEVFRVEIDLFDVGFDKPQEFIEVA